MNQVFNYASCEHSTRAVTAASALICSVAGLVLGLTAFIGILSAYWIGVVSFYLVGASSFLSILALIMRGRRNWIAILALVISLAYWVIVKYWVLGDPRY